MLKPLSFGLDGDHYVLLRRPEHPEPSDEYEPVTAWEVRRVLTRAVSARSGANARLRALLGDPPFERGWPEDRSLHHAMEALLSAESSAVALWRRARSLRASTMGHPPTDALADASDEAPLAPMAWIEVQVVDDDDTPCRNIEYEIELSDGRVRRGRTNDSGVLRYESIPGGNCKLRLPKLDAETWNLL